MKYVSFWARGGVIISSHCAFRKHQFMPNKHEQCNMFWWVIVEVVTCAGAHVVFLRLTVITRTDTMFLTLKVTWWLARVHSPEHRAVLCLAFAEFSLSRVTIYEVTALHCDSSVITSHCFLIRRSWIIHYTIGRGLNKNISKHQMIALTTLTNQIHKVLRISKEIREKLTETTFKETYYLWQRKRSE
jgi:hypothetical protein